MLHGLLVVGALIAALIGLISLSEATMGVGVLAFALFLGVLARLVQAEAHQREVLRSLGAMASGAPEAQVSVAHGSRSP